MPQHTLFGDDIAAYQLHLELRSDPLHPEAPLLVTIRTHDAKGELIREKAHRLVGIEADFAATLVQSVTEGYLWGDSFVAPFHAARRVHKAARNHRLTHDPRL